ncbi:alpha/beta hydrolase [filamentous cyanobacterium LEGE 11480]|uniref:Alpha/beta hydrolase n=1 Tax=Romeriopsis navalis LEGE 11480 TaxID=2777977 RepID=A0A928Z0M6_9CYAN|nr:alpha/beta hydrolase [Romeriopsis navalis]MBE9028426.1 alpha/beta hydrolase [Romeriopsis navalis LEGE 11480]
MSFRNWLTQIPDWKVLIRIPVLIYCTIAAYGFFFADRQMFIPQYASQAPLPKPPIAITTPNGEIITLVHLTHPQATHTILYSHGNAETLGSIYPHLLKLKDLGFNVIAYDYRGYGLSQGTPSETNAYQDIEATYKYATEQLQIPSRRIILFGRSIGGGPSTYLASQKPIAGLILESTFTSIFRVVIPFPLLPFDKFPNRDRIAQVKAPVLIIHGNRDEIIPFEHGKILFQAASNPKQFQAIPNAGHNDVSDIGGIIYSQAIKDFVAKIAKN